jgi:hypothetical protein
MRASVLCILSLAFTSLVGCGGSSSSGTMKPPPTPVSTWAGTYTGQLNFSGCPGTTPCGGDTITLNISEAAIGTGFSPTLTITGTDATTKQNFTGTGTALYTGAAPIGGSSSTTATATITLGDSLFILGSGSAPTGSPVLIQTCVINNTSTSNGNTVKGPKYLGTLTRQ